MPAVKERLAAALDAVWAAVDPDEPMFCECTGSRWCADCALSAPVPAASGWGAAPAAPPIAAA